MSYSNPDRPTIRRDNIQASIETPSASATQPACPTVPVNAADRCG